MKDFEGRYSVDAINQFLLIEPHFAQTRAAILLGNGCVSGDIARYAAQAYRNKNIQKIIITGGVQSKNPPLYDILSKMGLPVIEEDFKSDMNEADYMHSILLAKGIPADDIIFVEREATNTGENFEFTAHIFQENGINDATIFGVAYAARRAFQTGKRVLPHVDFYSHPVYPYGLDRQTWLGRWPTVDYIKNIIFAERQKTDPTHPNNYYDQGFCVPVELPKVSTKKLGQRFEI